MLWNKRYSDKKMHQLSEMLCHCSPTTDWLRREPFTCVHSSYAGVIWRYEILTFPEADFPTVVDILSFHLNWQLPNMNQSLLCHLNDLQQTLLARNRFTSCDLYYLVLCFAITDVCVCVCVGWPQWPDCACETTWLWTLTWWSSSCGLLQRSPPLCLCKSTQSFLI